VTGTPFALSLTHAPFGLLVRVVGEIDMATAPELGEAIGSAADRTRRIVVDLTEVSFLDSSALNTLVGCQRAATARQIQLCVVSPADRAVRRVFEIAHLTEPLGLVDSLDRALA
jgi:anti-anti-sigma factor